MVERPGAPRRRRSPRRAPTASRSTSRRRRTSTTRSPPCATRAAAPASRSARARRSRPSPSCVERLRPRPVHDGQPRLGRPAVPARLARQDRAPARAGRRPARRSRSTAASTRTTAGPCAARRARRCSSQDRPSSAPKTPRRPTEPWRRPPRSLSVASRMGAPSAPRPQSFTRPWATRILIVDDHPSFRASARVVLESEGFEVVGEAVDGASALHECCRLRPEVVLLDVQLPDIDGFDVCEQITAYAEHPTVIMTSSRDGSDFGPLVIDVGRMRVRAQGRALGGARAGAARPVTGLRRALGLVAIEGIVVGLVALAIVLSSDHVDSARRDRRARAVHRLVVHRRRPVRLVAPARQPLRRADDRRRLRVLPRRR